MPHHTVAETAVAAHVTTTTVYRHMALGLLRTVKVGGRRLVPDDALREWLRGDRIAA